MKKLMLTITFGLCLMFFHNTGGSYHETFVEGRNGARFFNFSSMEVKEDMLKYGRLISALNCVKTELDERYDEVLEFERFLNDIAFRESGNNWKAWNQFGFIGKFQFGGAALRDVGYGHINFREFLNDPNTFPIKTQRIVMIKYLHKNYNTYLTRVVRDFEGTNFWGMEITASGLLAGAHLGGAGSVRNYLYRGVDRSDAFGTSVSRYMRDFGGYEFKGDVIELMLRKYYLEKEVVTANPFLQIEDNDVDEKPLHKNIYWEYLGYDEIGDTNTTHISVNFKNIV